VKVLATHRGQEVLATRVYVNVVYEILHPPCHHQYFTLRLSTNDMSATKKQIKAINWFLWQEGAKWSEEIDKKIEELDGVTASDLIGAFRNDNTKIAMNQLRHLGILEPLGDCNGCGKDHDPHECPKL